MEEVFLVVEDEDELERCPNFVVEVVWEPTGIGGGGAGKVAGCGGKAVARRDDRRKGGRGWGGQGR